MTIEDRIGNVSSTITTAAVEALIGGRIVSARTERHGRTPSVAVLTVRRPNNGTVTVRVTAYGDCCTWADIRRVAAVDNVITEVRPTLRHGKGDEVRFKLHVITSWGDDVVVDGRSCDSDYYASGWTIEVGGILD